jgi:hypothetical protein
VDDILLEYRCASTELSIQRALISGYSVKDTRLLMVHHRAMIPAGLWVRLVTMIPKDPIIDEHHKEKIVRKNMSDVKHFKDAKIVTYSGIESILNKILATIFT